MMFDPPPRGGPGPHTSALLDILSAAGLSHPAIDELLMELDALGSERQPLLERVAAAGLPPKVLQDISVVLEDPEAVRLAIRRRDADENESGTALILRWCEKGLDNCDVRLLARIARLCRAAAPLVRQAVLWQRRCVLVCDRWALMVPEAMPWREAFYEGLRPRWDGIYVGECRYLRSHEERRTWINYRRYLRLFPPDAAGIHRALVLQDPGPLDFCLEVLLGLDPSTHVSVTKQKDLAESAGGQKQKHRQGDRKSALEDCTFTATYEFADGAVCVSYPSNQGTFDVRFRVGHEGRKNFSERLEWLEYSLTDRYGERDDFRLNLNSRGEPRNMMRVHYPVLQFRALEEIGHCI